KLGLEHRIRIRFLARVSVPNLSETVALLALAVRRVKRKQTRIELLKRLSAVGTTHLHAQNRDALFFVEQLRRPASDLDRACHEIAQIFFPALADDHVDRMFLETLQFFKAGGVEN